MKAEEFGDFIKGLRKEKKLTIRQLELYSGVSNAYISQVERGARGIPSPEILQKLSKPLGVKYELLMEKAGYITKEEIFKTAITEGFLRDADYNQLFNYTDDPEEKAQHIEVAKLLLEDPDKLFELAGKEASSKFLNELFSDETYDEYWGSIASTLLKNKGLDPEKAREVFSELENLSENELDEVIDFIRYKKSRTRDK